MPRHPWSASLFLVVLGACASDSTHRFREPWRDDLAVWIERLLVETGEPPIRPGDRLVRFTWLRSFDDQLVVTAGFDEDVAFVRYVRRPRQTREWSAPRQVLPAASEVTALLDGTPPGCHWENREGLADGSYWVFEGAGWTALRRSPEPGSEWFGYGLRFLQLAELGLSPDEIY